MECLCVKCLNFSLIVDTLHALDIVVHQRSILNVVSTICPFLVHKDDLEEYPVNSSPRSLVQPFVKPTSITFGHTELWNLITTQLKLIGKELKTLLTLGNQKSNTIRTKILITVDNIHEKFLLKL